MSLSTTPDRPRGGRLALEAVVVLAIALLVMVVARSYQPLGLIGLTNDDGLYALYAKALHYGKGYIDLSHPTPRPASRYPIGMPALLALVATGTTTIQAMIARFEWVPVIAGGLYTVTCYAYFRRFARLGAVVSAGLTAGIALSYSPMFAAFNVMSDMPCAVLTLWTIMALERRWHRAWEGPRPWMGWALAGVIAGLAMLFRYSSASLFAAIAIAMTKDRMWKPMLATFVGAAVPLLPWFAFRASLGGETYASEYSEHFPVLGKVVYAFGHSAGSLIAEAIPTLMLPLSDARSLATLAIGALVSTLVLFGAVRWFREPRAHETPLAPSYVLVTLAMALLWQMSFLYLQLELAGRLLVAAIPLMFLCLGRGVHEVALLLGGRDLPWRRLAAVACLALAAVRIVPLGMSLAHGDNRFVTHPAPPAALQMLEHIRQTVKPNEVLYAWNGPMVALYTDRTSYPLLVMYGITTVDVTRTLLNQRPAYVLGWPNYDGPGHDATLALINAFQKEVPNVLLTEWISPDPRLVLFRVDYAELDRQVAAAKAAPKSAPPDGAKMTTTPETFEHFFERVVSQLPGYEPRAQQVEMAERILDTVEHGGQLLIEAGTGSGKSFGYLMPALYAGKTIVISTGTINLQEQLIEKDLPFLLKASGSGMTVALAKGRGNYLCRQKLWEADRQISTTDPLRRDLNRIMGMIEDWDGDLASLPFSPENRFWGEIASTSDDCLGNKCEFFDQNPFRIARVKLGKADIIVANHALYMIDLATGGGILPEHDLVIFDEAHHLPRVASQAFTATIGRYALTKLLQKIRRRWQSAPDRLSFKLIDVESRLADWLWRHDRAQFRLYPDTDFLRIAEDMLDGLHELRVWLENGKPDDMLFDDPAVKSKAPLHRPKLLAQLTNLIARWEFFSGEAGSSPERVNWVELNRETGYFELLSAPLDVSRDLSELLWKQRTAVLTSATMSVDGDFSYYRAQLGLPSSVGQLCLPSPFDYETQARLYVPRLPEPNDPRFESASHKAILELLHASRGRAFVLFTSYRAMKQAYHTLANEIPYPCKLQGELPRTRLVEWFKETPGAVLFATSSFWEGVDVPGEALSCVIIDRLPFAVPDDPLVQAYVEQLKAQGRDWFREYTLPEAILRLKQGFGRLIRTSTDTGVVAILDARLHTKNYGRQILKALPPCPRMDTLAPLEAWLSSPDRLPF